MRQPGGRACPARGPVDRLVAIEDRVAAVGVIGTRLVRPQDVADAADTVIFVSRAGVDVDSNAGKGSGKGFAGYSNAVGESRDLVEISGVLYPATLY